MAVEAWEQRVRHRVGRWLSRGLGARWVVAVSGGSDSVGLLRLLHRVGPELGVELTVAHLDHGVRAEAGRQDAEFVAGLARELELPLDLGRWSPSRPAHFEVDARHARYAWLAEVARARGASVVAVGHTRDDQAETILHRVVRGTGPHGLSGMAAQRSMADGVTLVRPLLKVSREEVRTLLAELGQPYREDATNDDQSRTRARIRHDLLPKLTGEYNPQVAAALVRLGELTAASQRILAREVERAARAVTIEAEPGAVALNNARLARLPKLLRAEVLRLAWRRVGWPEAGMDARRWNRLAALVRRGRGRFSIGAGVDAWISDQAVHLVPVALASVSAVQSEVDLVPLSIPGSVCWGRGRISVTLDSTVARDETIDFDRLVAPLQVRGPRPGDRFEPLGMGGRSTPLNDFFRGRQVPPAERRQVPLVCDELGIVWVVGHRIAHRVGLSPSTAREVGLRWVLEAESQPGRLVLPR